MSQAPRNTASLYRIDRFDVPAAALEAFMERLRQVQQALDPQPGCLQNLVLAQPGDGGDTRVVTLVEWASAEAAADAKAVMQQRYAQEGFDPPAFMKRLGVRADFGAYRNA
jgi:heme-degrading monooxygenase HmoA